jgi:hypothetical protein
MSGERVTLVQTLIANADPCTGYYLSFNYSTPSDIPQHLAFQILRIGLTEEEDEVVIETDCPYDSSAVRRRRFSGDHTALENPWDLGGVWFRIEHADFGESGLWVCISPKPQTMGLVTQE